MPKFAPKFAALLMTLLMSAGVAQAADMAAATATAGAKPAVQPAGDAALVPTFVMGDPKAPVTVEEFVSLTCPHCAEFYTTVLPVLEKKYGDTGQVKFILRDFPLDGPGLKAAALTRCLPADQYYPFIAILYKNQAQWAYGDKPEQTLLQYARFSGLSDEKAKACIADEKMLDAIAAGRQAASDKYDIQATPTFVINNGQDKIVGARSADEFSKVLDKYVAPVAK